jgi:hypothetical protein
VRWRTPPQVRARVPGERVLAWVVSGDSSLVATEAALVLPDGDAPGARVAWDLVLRAHWEADVVEVTAQSGAGGRPVLHRIALDADPGALPEVVRERVNASIVVQHHVELVGERGARLVARRTPGSDELRWSVVFDPGLDPRDPDLRRRADEALTALRVALGV